MQKRLKPLSEQVVVITGATSGIGLATARLAASRGARLVLAARNGEALLDLVKEVNGRGIEALAVPTDVGVEQDVRHLAQSAIQRFGGFDTWVNNAGVSIFGEMIEVASEDHRKLFETNFWGVVNGSVEAAKHFRDRSQSYDGALINIGSVLSDRAIPVQGMYSASKFAVKGFTEAFRMELEAASVPVSVTLIKPSSINTPFTRYARNYLDREPTLPPPVYKSDVVAEAILHCAEHPERDVVVGGGGKAISLLGNLAPRTSDRVMESTMFRAQRSDDPPRDPEGALEFSKSTLDQDGDYKGHVMGSSLYTRARFHPVWTGVAAVGVGLLVAALIPRMGTNGSRLGQF